MTSESVTELSAVLDELKSQMAALVERIERLEGAKAASPVTSAPVPVETPANGTATSAPAPRAAEPPAPEETISEEVLLAIAAAVAAFLGERAHIRQVRLIRTSAWAQEGRVSIQASHRLH